MSVGNAFVTIAPSAAGFGRALNTPRPLTRCVVCGKWFSGSL